MPIDPVPTFTAQIYCGLREGYDGRQHHAMQAQTLCRTYCDEVGLGLTVTETTFVYKGKDGWESGVIVGLINYPRFPKAISEVKEHARELARRLKDTFKQERVSIVFPDVTETLGEL